MDSKKRMSAETKQIIESSIIAVSSSFPVLSSLAAGWNEYKNYKQVENIKEILEAFAKKLTEINKRLDFEFLRTEDAKRLVEQALMVGKDQINKSMRGYISEFLANASTIAFSKDPEKQMVLETISRLSEFQIKLLVTITKNLIYYEGHEQVLLGVDFDSKIHKIKYIYEKDLIDIHKSNASKLNIEASLDYMMSLGIIETGTPRYLTDIGDRGFRPTKLGIKTLEYLGYYIKDAKTNIS
jgi:hypothetical protein